MGDAPYITDGKPLFVDEANKPRWKEFVGIPLVVAVVHTSLYLTAHSLFGVSDRLMGQTAGVWAIIIAWRYGWRAGLVCMGSLLGLNAALSYSVGGSLWAQPYGPTRLAGYATAAMAIALVGKLGGVSRSLSASQMQLARFRSVMDEAAEAIFVADPISWAILDTNETACSMLGYTRDELISKSLADIEVTEDLEALSSDPLPGGPGDFRLRTERSYLRKDGSKVPVEVIRAQKSFKGRAYLVAVARDLSERREMEQRLLETERKRMTNQAESQMRKAEQQLTQANKLAALGTLAAGVGHEINNPLTYVLGNLQYVNELLNRQREHLPEASFNELQELVNDTWEGAGRIRAIVRDLKVFSRQDDDNRLDRLSVHDTVQDALKLVRSQLRYRAELTTDLRDVPDVRVNRSRFTQVLVNLLINSAQAMTEDSEERRIFVTTARDHDGQAMVEVRDTGKGIPAEQLEHIFDPFFTTKPSAGTGLGLAICYEIIASFGGDIQVESKPGQGTTMRVLLPAAGPMTQHPPAPAPKPSKPLTVEGARVLVVDDEPYVAKLFMRILRGADVTVVYSGAEALKRLHEDEDYDVVFCDLMMPEMTGMQLRSRLVEELPRYVTRTLFITGGAFTPEAREFLEAHGDQCMEKPLSNQEVRNIVREKRAARAA